MSSSQLPPGVPIQNIPAAKPPQGVRPNFIDPPSYKHEIIILEGIFVPLMLLFVFMRVFVRTRITKTWGWDDTTCIVSACGSVVHMINYTQMFGVGFGRHLWDIRAITLLDAGNSQLLSANGIVYPFTILFVKLSIMLLYLRIFNVDRAFRLVVSFGIIFQVLYYTAMIGVAIGSIKECNGPSQASKSFCKNYGNQVVVLNATVNVATDIFILVLPVSRVLKLQLGTRRRVGLLLVFATGVITCAVSLARLIDFCVHYGSSDTLWVQGRNAVYTIVEINVAIIVACASCFPAFFTKVRVFSGSVISLLRSRITTTRVSDTKTQSSSGPTSKVVQQKVSADSDGWYGDKARLREGSCLELRDGNEFHRSTAVKVGNKSDSDMSAEQENSMDEPPGILRTTGYQVESSSRV